MSYTVQCTVKNIHTVNPEKTRYSVHIYVYRLQVLVAGNAKVPYKVCTYDIRIYICMYAEVLYSECIQVFMQLHRIQHTYASADVDYLAVCVSSDS